MLTDPAERFIVSSLGWVEHGALWILDVASSAVRVEPLGDAKYLSLYAGVDGHFSVVHHYEGDRVEITAHSFHEPADVLSRAVFAREDGWIEGSLAPWAHLPRHYIAHFVRPSGADVALVSIDATEAPSLQRLEWFDGSYDKFYQGIIGVTEIPGSHNVLVSAQRSSRIIVHDPRKRTKVGEFVLAEKQGNPSLFFRRSANELWADDYDTLLKLDPNDWTVKRSRNLQDAEAGVGKFIGQFAFDAAETLCAVARPFSGDVIALDPNTLETKYRSRVGGQPLEVALLRDHRVFARDWKSGKLLSGGLRRAWLA